MLFIYCIFHTSYDHIYTMLTPHLQHIAAIIMCNFLFDNCLLRSQFSLTARVTFLENPSETETTITEALILWEKLS